MKCVIMVLKQKFGCNIEFLFNYAWFGITVGYEVIFNCIFLLDTSWFQFYSSIIIYYLVSFPACPSFCLLFPTLLICISLIHYFSYISPVSPLYLLRVYSMHGYCTFSLNLLLTFAVIFISCANSKRRLEACVQVACLSFHFFFSINLSMQVI